MPIYEYECPACGQFEVTQRITEDPLKRCPNCKKRKVRKLMSNTSFQLKGSGWYITDYARKGGGAGPTGEAKGGGESSGDGKSDAKGDSKSDAKGESKSESKSEGKSGKDGKAGKKENKAA